MNRQLTISTGETRASKNWRPESLSWQDFCERLRTSRPLTCAYNDYLRLQKPQQDALKDVGGFMGGTLNGPRRKAAAVTGRDLVTLDFDSIPTGQTEALLQKVHALGCAYAVYSTAKHCPNNPRLRVIVPLDRTVTPDEYEPLARRIAEHIGMEWADPTTFEASRLMYWPTHCSDIAPVFDSSDAAPAPADDILGTFHDWHNAAEWPQIPGVLPRIQRLAATQGDPTSKDGIVGTFCRTYDVPAAIAKFLPTVYAPCDTADGRYTYTGGSTAGGAVLYDDGKFLYSRHATDPCSGRLVNAFDLVRLHLFGAQDDDMPPDTATRKRPSYKAMCEFAMNDDAVKQTQAREEAAELQAMQNACQSSTPAGDDVMWRTMLERDESGKAKQTIGNVELILEHDPNLQGHILYNEFSERIEVLHPLPWGADLNKTPDKFKRRAWADSDDSGLYGYMERGYKITKRPSIDAGLANHVAKHTFNEVQQFIKGLAWDGVPRLDTLLIDCLGAEDSEYTRAVTRKAFVGAVARAMEPGCKFDNMLILCGPQGIGKSTMLDRMSKGWFNDSIRTFEGKEASELLQGVWLVEVAELDAFRRSDVSRIKQFLSLRSDRYRAAYGRNVKELPRRCVFFGTTNTSDFLQDTTGNRRFWPVDVGVQPIKHHVWDLTEAEIDQLWAEAKCYWMMGEPLFLTGALADAAAQHAEEHREELPQEGMIADFVEKPIPADWRKWPLDKRRDYWAGACKGQNIPTVQRKYICAIEVWCECFNHAPADMSKANAREINAILTRLQGWQKSCVDARPYSSTARGFSRKPMQLV